MTARTGKDIDENELKKLMTKPLVKVRPCIEITMLNVIKPSENVLTDQHSHVYFTVFGYAN